MIAVYAENTWPRRSFGVCAFSQLSITMNSPTRHAPFRTRSAPQSHGPIASAWTIAVEDAIAANIAKARMWPTRRTIAGQKKVPRKNPTKYADMMSPITTAANPSRPARTPSSVPKSPLPVISTATPRRSEETE